MYGELGFIDRCRKIITAPSDFFKASFNKDLMPSVIHFAIITVLSLVIATITGIIGGFIGAFFSAVFGIVSGADVGAALMAAVGNLVSSLIGSVVAIFFGFFMVPVAVVLAAVSALITHVFLYLLGARGGWQRTVKTFYYISTFSLVASALNIIPFLGPLLGFVVGLYALYVSIKAYSLQHQISMMKSAIAVIAPIAIMILIGLMIAFIIMLVGGGLAALSFLPLLSQ